MNIKLMLMSACVAAMGVTTVQADATFPLTNNSSFYFFFTSGDSSCPKEITPNQSVKMSGYCGYNICATEDGKKDGSCKELSGDGSSNLTEGGYLSYVGINSWTHSCNIGADWYPYQCQWDKKTGQFNFSYNGKAQIYYSNLNPKIDKSYIGQAVSLPKISSYSSGPQLRGINQSGLEYDGTFLDALFQHPDIPDMLYFAQQGMNTVRLPIRWEFLLSDPKNAVESHDPLSAAVNQMYMDSVYDVVQKYLNSGLTVILDLHNYMRFCSAGAKIGQNNEPTNAGNNSCKLMTNAQLSYVWSVIATKFSPLAKKYPKTLIFELMNEPFSMDKSGQQLKVEDLFKAEVDAVHAIRQRNLNNLILLSGNYWDALHGWVEGNGDGTANGSQFTAKNLAAANVDISNVAIDMHQYFDANWSGTHEECQSFSSYDDFKQKLGLNDSKGVDVFGNWLKQNQMKVFLGEFGGGDNPICRQDINYMLLYITQHAYGSSAPKDGGFIGWTVWRANKHGSVGFNFLQREDDNVYGGTGSHVDGKGIAAGPANDLMNSVFANYLVQPKSSNENLDE